ncbi:large-conductance mechanosensitive channel protein MscL [Deltaproteobacteria bacterium OttesenSCG-928-K17]|nr:large-conductance mechanosensitive channel protein MscL [Deltaproteobacteria bacterium OttesenSCG-928-K17]
MNIGKEFREFILRGNVVDMSVGIIVGAAFGKLVDSLVKDIIMPPIGLLLGKVDFTNLFITLKDGAAAPGPYHTLELAQQAGAVTLNLGLFINMIISLIIVGAAVFMLVKGLNKLRREPEAAEAEPDVKTCPYCVSEINIKASRCPNCTSHV